MNFAAPSPLAEPVDLDEACRFLSAIVLDARVSLVAIPPDKPPSGAVTFGRSDHVGMAAWIEHQAAGGANIYFHVNPLKDFVSHRKASKSEIKHVVQLHVDIDDPEGLQRIQDFPLAPTAVICSGNGYHSYWQLEAPCSVEVGERLNAVLAKRLGGDACSKNADRLLRVPGTLNLPNRKKRGDGRVPARAFVVAGLTNFDLRYEISDLEAELTEWRDPVSTTPTGTPVVVDALGLPSDLSDETLRLIRTGGEISPRGYPSRSEALWRVACDLVAAGLNRHQLAAVISNPEFGISACILDKPDPPKEALRQADKALAKARVSRRKDSDWEVGRGGIIRPTMRNAQTALLKLGGECKYDRFRGRFYVQGEPIQEFAGEMSDRLTARLRDVIMHTFDFDPGKQNTHDAMEALALQNSYNSMEDYFDGLVWDQKPRLEEWLITYCGAEDTAFNRSVGAKMLIAAVRRVRKPGTKFDFALVMESPEGGGKSSVPRILAGAEHFSDQGVLGMDEKAQMEALEGILIFELSELDGMSRSDSNKTKAFLSRSEDRVRPAYGRHRESRPRTCIFMGTTNDRNYLRSPTGNRRFWPVGVSNIDLDGLQQDRDQLWAEAAFLEAQGAPIDLELGLYAAATALQTERLEEEPWVDALRDLDGESVEGEIRIFTSTVFNVLVIPAEGQTSGQARRLGAAMHRLGWEGPRLIRIGSKGPARGFWRPAPRP